MNEIINQMRDFKTIIFIIVASISWAYILGLFEKRQ